MSNRINKICLNCQGEFSVPRCRDWREHCCSSTCKSQLKTKRMEISLKDREKSCKCCGSKFFPRKQQLEKGQGIYCSVKCASHNLIAAAHTVDANNKRATSRKRSIDSGLYVVPSGENHPRWKGGKGKYYERNKKRIVAALKEYRRRNPHKTREWHQNRRARTLGKLPNGFIFYLYGLQKGRCVVCKICLDEGYHIDHIQPLSKGGDHKPSNIQLLCPSCNVKKASKDPLKFMRERGFLL